MQLFLGLALLLELVDVHCGQLGLSSVLVHWRLMFQCNSGMQLFYAVSNLNPDSLRLLNLEPDRYLVEKALSRSDF
jgi:hypothetical protein